MKRLALLALCAAACNDSTGYALVTFQAAAGGPADAAAPLAYTTGAGYALTLTRADFHLGAIYLNQSVPTSGAGASVGCVLPGTYVAQAFGPLDLDLLSPALVPFPTEGNGTSIPARTAEVWLLEGDIGATDSNQHVLDAAGIAEKDGVEYPFSATVTIGQNRALPAPNVAMPGANPICAQRIVTPIEVELTPSQGGRLALRVDPRHMFDGVDFAGLAPTPGTLLPSYVIPDEKGGVGGQLFNNLRSNASPGGVYTFSFSP